MTEKKSLLVEKLGEMPSEAKEILHFWLEETPRENHFIKDFEFDQQISQKFSGAWRLAEQLELDYWKISKGGRFAFILLIDQFSRNMFRDTPKAFVLDPMALSVARKVIAEQDYLNYETSWKMFCILPFMHSENLDDQNMCVELAKSVVKNQNTIDFAQRHQVIIERFGRFPHRNAILGRESTDEERAFLQQPNSSF